MQSQTGPALPRPGTLTWPISNRNPLDLIKRDLVTRAIV
jgi:hypothetical protein